MLYDISGASLGASEEGSRDSIGRVEHLLQESFFFFFLRTFCHIVADG